MTGKESNQPEVTVKEVPSLKVATTKSNVPYDDIGRVLMELFRWVLTKGVKVASYPMAVFPEAAGETTEGSVRFEACIPIDPDSKVQGSDEVSITSLPPLKVASARHHGAFREVGRTYDAILAWVSANGYRAEGPTRELYLVNPLEASEEELITEVQVPVAEGRH